MKQRSIFLFPFDWNMTQLGIDLELEKIKDALKDSPFSDAEFVGLRGCTMHSHICLAYEEMEPSDFNDGINGVANVVDFPQPFWQPASPDSDSDERQE